MPAANGPPGRAEANSVYSGVVWAPQCRPGLNGIEQFNRPVDWSRKSHIDSAEEREG